MKSLAIVLSCDEYHPFAENMIRSYQLLWPDHPFVFRVPYQETASRLSADVRDYCELIPTDKSIKATVLTLLKDLHDDQWVYWCIDDKYPCYLDTRLAARICQSLPVIEDRAVSGISLCRARGLLDHRRLLDKERLTIDGTILLRRRDYAQIWLHQFLRVKVLRHLFHRFPDQLSAPKEMDRLKDGMSLPSDHKLYVVRRNAAVFGESTTRGRVTANCRMALRSNDLPVPPGFAASDEQILIGRKPRSLPWSWGLRRKR